MTHPESEDVEPDQTPEPIVHRRRSDGMPFWAYRWLPLALVGAVSLLVGIIGTTIASTEWADRRYVRRDEFVNHDMLQKEFQGHQAEDRRSYATKEEVDALRNSLQVHAVAPSHIGTAGDLTAIRVSLAQMQADVAWLKEQERRRGGK